MRLKGAYVFAVLLITLGLTNLIAGGGNERTLPVIKEPDFVVWDNSRPRPIVHIVSSVDAIVAKFQQTLQLDKNQFAFEKSSLVKSGDHLYRRDVFLYTHASIDTMHGPPSQPVIVWYEAPDGGADGRRSAIYTAEAQWPL